MCDGMPIILPYDRRPPMSETAKTPRRKSILIFFVATTVLFFVVVLVFNSIVIQGLVRDYRTLASSQQILNLCKDLFEVIACNGYERGRVNVVLNFQGNPQEMRDSIDFIGKNRERGETLLQQSLDRIKQEGIRFDLETYEKLRALNAETVMLRERYMEQFQVPFAERDLKLDDTWFSHMSKQIEALNLLIYSIKDRNRIDPELRHYIDMIYLLSMLRDNAGPVVSYLKAATFNRTSLTPSRIEELKRRENHVKNLLDRLRVDGKHFLPLQAREAIATFDRFYFSQVMVTAEYILENEEVHFVTPVDFRSYLKNGVIALEQLQSLTHEILDLTDQVFGEKLHQEQIRIAAAITLSALVLLAIVASLFHIYKAIYRRILLASDIIQELSHNNLEVAIAGAGRNDEIGDIESALVRFRDNLVALNQSNARLSELSQTDSMTGLLNHRTILERLETLHKESLRYRHSYALLMIDIDLFKEVNDTYGHLVGDEVIQEFARTLKESTRSTDLVARYGGEEFLVVFPHTCSQTAMEMAEKLRYKIERTSYSSRTLHLTASIGVSGFSAELSVPDVVARADKALYRAKTAGRNGVRSLHHTDNDLGR